MKTLITTLLLLPTILFAQDFYSETTTYEYDDFDRLIHAVFDDGREYIYTYDELGNRNQIEVIEPYVEPPIEDVFPDDIYLSEDTIGVGESFVISMNQEYVGSTHSSELEDLRIIFALSEDCILAGGDFLVHDVYSNLGSDIGFSTEWTEYTIPAEFDPGTYYLIAKADYNDAVDEIDEDNNTICIELLITPPLSLEQEDQNLVNIYPNPSTDMITVNHSFNDATTLEIYDSNGRLVISQILTDKTTDIDISHLESGIYSAQIMSGDALETQKIIKL